MKKGLIALAFFTCLGLTAQNNTSYWQQEANYKMNVDMNVKNFQYTGEQELEYVNNSPDTLKRVYFHLFYNAFQPGSEMDVRSRTIADSDSRVGDRISKLTPQQQGYLKVNTLSMNGKSLEYEEVGTVLEVDLDEYILPGETVNFSMKFAGQVPEQIRRAGRNSHEGVALSMVQWYPKLAEYDFEGWHADPYIGREWHGVWGDYDVKITIDKNYILGASGVLQNANEIGYGYEDEGVKVKRKKGDKLTWHFIAEDVIDYAWAADPDYIHDKRTAADGTVLHFLYKNNPDILENWKNLQPVTEELLLYFNENIGPYPWPQYSVIQGGDGGMEYAMLTLITGERKFGSLVGVTSHELAHAWFQHLMATNESKHEWMDEGFTSYISDLAVNKVLDEGRENPFAGSYRSYLRLANSGVEQPQTTHADRYEYNAAYGASAYSKGAVFMAQLGYVIGEENLKKTIKRYYNEWKFKHPTPNDFIRVAEKVTGAELDWYLMDWTQTTNTIDYGIMAVEEEDGQTNVVLQRIGLMPMPIEVEVTYTDGTSEEIYIPLQMMRWEKPGFEEDQIRDDWAWAYPTYSFLLDKPKSQVASIEIDPSQLMADVNRENNVYPKQQPQE
jgi:hypothetical protein